MYTNLKIELVKKSLTQKEIADYIGIHENSMGNKISNGSFSVEEAFKIKAKFFPECSLEYLFKRTAWCSTSQNLKVAYLKKDIRRKNYQKN